MNDLEREDLKNQNLNWREFIFFSLNLSAFCFVYYFFSYLCAIISTACCYKPWL
jgi:hypothetical protein